MEEVQRYIAEYRDYFYLLTIVWTFLEGETFVLLAAAVAASGTIDPYKLGAAAWCGSYLGDQCWFFVGRKAGPFLLRKFPDWKHGIDMVHRWLERWDVLFILTFRFIYGIRNFSSAAMGLSELSILRFMVLNFIGAGLWSATFVTAGYLFGHAIGRLLGQYALAIELSALGIFALAVLTILAVTRWRSRRARRLALLQTDRP